MTHGDPKTRSPRLTCSSCSDRTLTSCFRLPHSLGLRQLRLHQPIADLRGPDGHRLKPIGALSRQTGSPPPGATGWRAEWPLRPWPFVRRRYTRGGQKPPCSAWPRPSPKRRRREGTPNQAGRRGCYERSAGDNPHTVLTPALLWSFSESPDFSFGYRNPGPWIVTNLQSPPFREWRPQSSGLQPGLRWSHREGRGGAGGGCGETQGLPCTLSDSPWAWLGQQLNFCLQVSVASEQGARGLAVSGFLPGAGWMRKPTATPKGCPGQSRACLFGETHKRMGWVGEWHVEAPSTWPGPSGEHFEGPKSEMEQSQAI